MRNNFQTIQELYALEARARLARVPQDPPSPPRSIEKLSLDERNIEQARANYFHLAFDKAGSHCDADTGLPVITALRIQETALREAADMVASRLRVGVERHQLTRLGAERDRNG